MPDEYRRNQESAPTEDAKPRYKEVGGWLSFLCFGLTVCTPLATIVSLAASYSESSGHFGEFPGLLVVFVIDTILSFGLVAFSIYAGIGLWCIRRGAVQTAKLYLLCFLGYQAFAAILPFTAGLPAAAHPAMIAEVAKGTTKGVLYFVIWYWYLAKSKRVKNTYGDDESLPFGEPDIPKYAHKAENDLGSYAPSAARHQEIDLGSKPSPPFLNPPAFVRGVFDPRTEPCSTDERVTAVPPANAASATDAEWHIIQAGNEISPFSRSELVQKVVAGEISADDLVKQDGGVWTKARDVDFLQRQFLLRDSRAKATQERLDKLGHFHGIWISKKALVIGGCVLLVFVGLSVWNICKPTNSPKAETASKDAIFYFNRGDAWLAPFSDKDYDKAIKDFDEAIRLDPKNARFYSRRGDAWLSKYNYDKAIQDYDEAIRLDPNCPSDYSRRAAAWWGKKDYDKAIRDFDEAVRLDPNDAFYFSWRGSCWSDKKFYDNAIKDYGEAVRLAPKGAYFYVQIAWLLATCPEERMRDGKRAIHLATMACELTDWKSGLHMDALAAAYAEAGQFDEAERYQRKALEPACTPVGDGFRERFRDRLELYKQRKPFREGMSIKRPDVRIFLKSDGSRFIRGTVHNETGKSVDRLKLSIKTSGWERTYTVNVSVPDNTTHSFSIYVGEAVDVERFEVLRE